MQEWKMQEEIAGVENAGVENAGATKYENTLRYQTKYQLTLKYQTKYGCRGFHAYLLPNATRKRVAKFMTWCRNSSPFKSSLISQKLPLLLFTLSAVVT